MNYAHGPCIVVLFVFVKFTHTLPVLDDLVSTMGFPTLVRKHLCFETVHCNQPASLLVVLTLLPWHEENSAQLLIPWFNQSVDLSYSMTTATCKMESCHEDNIATGGMGGCHYATASGTVSDGQVAIRWLSVFSGAMAKHGEQNTIRAQSIQLILKQPTNFVFKLNFISQGYSPNK